jgi:hypothetical protein
MRRPSTAASAGVDGESRTSPFGSAYSMRTSGKWTRGACSIREIHETFPEKTGPHTRRSRLRYIAWKAKNAVRCVKRISNANICEAAVSRVAAQNRLVDELLSLFGGRSKACHLKMFYGGDSFRGPSSAAWRPL